MAVTGGGGQRTAVPAVETGTGQKRRANVGEFFIGDFLIVFI